MFPRPHYALTPSFSLFISPNVEQTFVITTVWTPRPARYPAAATWSVCVLPGLRETSARWTSVCDATELPASLTRRRATWFASECLVSARYSCSSFLWGFIVVLFMESVMYIVKSGSRWRTRHISWVDLIFIGAIKSLVTSVMWTTGVWIMHLFDKIATEGFLLRVEV